MNDKINYSKFILTDIQIRGFILSKKFFYFKRAKKNRRFYAPLIKKNCRHKHLKQEIIRRLILGYYYDHQQELDYLIYYFHKDYLLNSFKKVLNQERLKRLKKLTIDEKRLLNNKLKRDRINNNIHLKLNNCISSGIHGHLKKLLSNGEGYKSFKWSNVVNYSTKDLKEHLEKQFIKEMSWDNYGTYWHIDHKIPQSWFKFKSVDSKQFKKCWGLENLQPLNAKENLIKGNRWASQ